MGLLFYLSFSFVVVCREKCQKERGQKEWVCYMTNNKPYFLNDGGFAASGSQGFNG